MVYFETDDVATMKSAIPAGDDNATGIEWVT